MKYHLERKLRAHNEPQYKSLYPWAINEFDDQGNQVTPDQIPWAYNLYFTASSCVLSDSVEIDSDKPEPSSPTVRKRQVIRARLKSGVEWDNGAYHGKTRFEMFGTSRAIEDFQIEIHSTEDESKQETCGAWGGVSYTADFDFRNETMNDWIIFYLFVKPQTFADYASRIASGAVDRLTLRVGLVAGFYSEWSPEVETDVIKVLVAGDEQKVELPEGFESKPPRLGEVGKAELNLRRHLNLAEATKAPPVAAKPEPAAVITAAPQVQPVSPDQTVQALYALRRVAWYVIALLALILVTLVAK